MVKKSFEIVIFGPIIIYHFCGKQRTLHRFKHTPDEKLCFVGWYIFKSYAQIKNLCHRVLTLEIAVNHIELVPAHLFRHVVLGSLLHRRRKALEDKLRNSLRFQVVGIDCEHIVMVVGACA